MLGPTGVGEGDLIVRDAVEDDFEAILRLNATWVHFTSPLDRPGLARLHEASAYHRVVVERDAVVAFLLALREGADYASPNYLWFLGRGGRFLYIDRVIVTGSRQGRGLARLLYADLFEYALRTGVPRVACELDVDPPNSASERFHDALGFREVGQQLVANRTKRVSLRELELVPADPES